MKKLLITGISGFLGSHFLELKNDDYEIFGTYQNTLLSYPNCFKIDLCNHQEVEQLINKVQPDAILHLAANSEPNYCELHPEETYKINVTASVNLAKIATQKNIQFLFTSSDLVFDGTNAPYSETDATNPIMEYGKQKVAAGKGILKVYPNAIIARMPLMFGISKYGCSFFTSWIDNLKTGKPLYAFTDESRTPVSGKTAMQGLLKLIEANVTGIYHLGGSESISRFDFAIQLAEVLKIDKPNIIASKIADVQMPAERPQNVSLNSTKAFYLGYQPMGVKDEIKQYSL